MGAAGTKLLVELRWRGILVLAAWGTLLACATPPAPAPHDRDDRDPGAAPTEDSPRLATSIDDGFFAPVSLSAEAFSPRRGEKVTLSFSLGADADVKVGVWDPDHGLVRNLLVDERLSAGRQQIAWDGLDVDGRVVADEAYFFTISARTADTLHVFDPTVFSGGEEGVVTRGALDPKLGTISYELDESARVLVRIGVRGGPLMNTLVDWEPRASGSVTEHWSGMDQDGVLRIIDDPGRTIVIVHYRLPEASVIAFGNRGRAYRDDPRGTASRRPRKPARDRLALEPFTKMSPHWSAPRHLDYQPPVDVAFPRHDSATGGVPRVSGQVPVRVTIPEEHLASFAGEAYELTFALNGEYMAEEEVGYVPYSWIWDVSNLEPGEHVLTVNLSSFSDRIGVRSRKVIVEDGGRTAGFAEEEER